ncbi:MAG: cation:dicarboxylate symporter family transporter [[Clostridium] scindens]
MGCSDEITSFVLPTGMTINMNGTTVMHMFAVTFIATWQESTVTYCQPGCHGIRPSARPQEQHPGNCGNNDDLHRYYPVWADTEVRLIGYGFGSRYHRPLKWRCQH